MEWINITNRLPGTDKKVLLSNGLAIFIGIYRDGFYFVNGIRILWAQQPTHWMPLPELPKD